VKGRYFFYSGVVDLQFASKRFLWNCERFRSIQKFIVEICKSSGILNNVDWAIITGILQKGITFKIYGTFSTRHGITYRNTFFQHRPRENQKFLVKIKNFSWKTKISQNLIFFFIILVLYSLYWVCKNRLQISACNTYLF
jgi:hypothetical protein